MMYHFYRIKKGEATPLQISIILSHFFVSFRCICNPRFTFRFYRTIRFISNLILEIHTYHMYQISFPFLYKTLPLEYNHPTEYANIYQCMDQYLPYDMNLCFSCFCILHQKNVHKPIMLYQYSYLISNHPQRILSTILYILCKNSDQILINC